MKHIAFLSVVFLSNFLFSQITLEHEYHDNAPLMSVASGEFYFIESTDSTFELYDVNHTHIKTIAPNLSPDDEIRKGLLLTSRTVFDADDSDIEIAFVVLNNPLKSYILYITEENGNVLFSDTNALSGISFGYKNGEYGIIKTSNGYKLSATFGPNLDHGTLTRIYSLPGTYHLKVGKKIENDLDVNGYPNPTEQYFVIPLNSNTNYCDQIQILSINGSEMERIIVAGQDIVKVDVSEYSNGLYIYNFIKDGQIKDSKKFIVGH